MLAAPQVVLFTWFFARLQPGRRKEFAWMFLAGGLVFGLVYLYKAWAAAGGLQWGPPYLLIFYPLLTVLGVQMVTTGLLAELVTRTYHEAQGKPIYTVLEELGESG